MIEDVMNSYVLRVAAIANPSKAVPMSNLMRTGAVMMTMMPPWHLLSRPFVLVLLYL